jgi:toxin ParE1/3/4
MNAFCIFQKNPELGVACDYIANGYRKIPQCSHLIFYKLNPEGGILIIRVLHKSMDVDSRV